jgi:hypothetical protein
MLILQAQFNVQWSVLQEGQFTDFTVSWYLNVGVSIVITMIAFIFSPHIGPIMMVAKRALMWVFSLLCMAPLVPQRDVVVLQTAVGSQLHVGPHAHTKSHTAAAGEHVPWSRVVFG